MIADTDARINHSNLLASQSLANVSSELVKLQFGWVKCSGNTVANVERIQSTVR